ncbi:MAG: hypothetical protein KA998_00745, partial [Rickettsiaceae bacterium]|nr:hypothetical protein [Rickettsiaceae bacterium]
MTNDTDFVKNDLLAKIKGSKDNNYSGYEIDEKKIEEFARSCWNLLTEEEKNNYKEQKDKDSTTT